MRGPWSWNINRSWVILCDPFFGDSKLTSPKLKDQLIISDVNNYIRDARVQESHHIFFCFMLMPASHKFLFCSGHVWCFDFVMFPWDSWFTTADTAPFARSIVFFFYQTPKFANPFRIILVMVHNPEPQIGVNVAFRDVQRSFFPMLGKKNGRLSLSQTSVILIIGWKWLKYFFLLK